jgi:DNA (cytosine-5)-methyltransferase 1
MSCFTFGSICSGIEAASVAFTPLGMRPAWFSEIEPFPCAVLAHHYPDTPNLGDMTTVEARVLAGEVEAPDMLCGGTPCQAFSVAGLRKSLDDARGNLSLVFCEIANAIDQRRAVLGFDPSVILWENVPGVLNTKDNAFGCFLAGLAGEDDPLVAPGGKWSNAGAVFGPQRTVAWRVLDAQYFGVAQRRRRVFVVASARTDFDPATVLFEFDGVRRDSAPSRQKGEAVAPTIRAGAANGGAGHGARSGDSKDELIVGTLQANGKAAGSATQQDAESGLLIAHSLRGEGFDASEDGTGRGTPLVPIVMPTPTSNGDAHSGYRDDKGLVPVAFHHNAQAAQLPTPERDTSITDSLTCSQQAAFATAMQVRRLTPRECERLQGFPDDYTLVPNRGKPAADGPRYKALGNSWAVPVVRWIGARIARELLEGLA